MAAHPCSECDSSVGTIKSPRTNVDGLICYTCFYKWLSEGNNYITHHSHGHIEVTPKPPTDRKKVASDGLATYYYRLPDKATELRHVIAYKSMSFARGNLFKACYRLGEKDGVDAMYDLNKMKFFIEDLIEMHKRGEHL